MARAGRPGGAGVGGGVGRMEEGVGTLGDGESVGRWGEGEGVAVGVQEAREGPRLWEGIRTLGT